MAMTQIEHTPMMEWHKQQCFQHCVARAAERYNGLHLTWDEWNVWNWAIRNKRPEVLYMEKTTSAAGGEVWRVWHNRTTPVYVCFRDGIVVTVLTAQPHYRVSVAKAVKKRQEAEKAAADERRKVALEAKKEADKEAALRYAIANRPKRDEAALARLKASLRAAKVA